MYPKSFVSLFSDKVEHESVMIKEEHPCWKQHYTHLTLWLPILQILQTMFDKLASDYTHALLLCKCG